MRHTAYGIRLGVFSDKEVWILEQCLPAIARSLHPVAAPDFSMMISWMLFTLGDAKNPRLLSIPDPLHRYTWQCQLAALKRDYLEPYYWPVADASQALAFLLRTHRPFEWNSGMPALRAAQCLALALSSGGIDDGLHHQLLSLRPFLPQAGVVYQAWPDTIDFFVTEFPKLI